MVNDFLVLIIFKNFFLNKCEKLIMGITIFSVVEILLGNFSRWKINITKKL